MMVTHDSQSPMDLLDAYVDGVLDPQQHAAFERMLEEHPELRNDLERQQRIDASLKRTMAPPSETTLRAILAEARTTASDHAPISLARRRISRPWRLAASLLLCAISIWAIWFVIGRGPDTGNPFAPPYRSMQTVYKQEQQRGFEPEWVCRDDSEFRATFEGRLGQPLLLNDLPEGMLATGIAFSHTLSPQTVYLLGKVGGQPVLVFIDSLRSEASARRQSAPPGLHLHRREVGDLVLYELSPLDTPRFLPYFYNPDRE